jgi:nucleotide-binding universal stress UspA family protein
MATGVVPVVVGVKDLVVDGATVRLAARSAALARRPLRVVHAFVWPLYGVGDEREHAVQSVEGAAARVRAQQPDLDVSAEVVDGAPIEVLLRAASEAALMVLGGQGLTRPTDPAVSVSVQLAARSTGAVLFARGDERPGPVAVGVDGSVDAVVGLRVAVEEARLRRTGLMVVHGQGAACAERGLDEAGVPVDHRVVDGPADEALVDVSGGAQLVVVGARGRRPTLLGPVTLAVLRHADCPILVVRSHPLSGGVQHSAEERPEIRASLK